MLKTYYKYGIIIAISLIAYFLMMKLLGLHEYPVFSIFNAILFGGGIYRAIKTHLRDNPDSKYQDLWQAGFMSGAIATIIFTAFMAIYMYQINSVFATQMLETWHISYNTGVLIMLFSMVLMGFSTSIVCVLTFMQRFKKSWNPQSTVINRN
ncbi:DUF4199 family protein [Aureitalea sp. L0-47]|uniref:DUF4199 domain-containing protein n=1 Tax=Aureitalea sp. L0-47 TaxID=2816962 RepID=UPI0022374F02|nr:DUF4199 domain-containing protein [Aureitalea sp. L0-47]MCW5518522.1 DUF4199 family protein [Aureitalea sp. L0-47]